VVFVSAGTRDSEFQHAEIGAARFSSSFVDGKLVLPLLIDHVEPPQTLKDLDHLDLRHRDATRAAQEIRDALARRVPRVRLFISHLHRESDLASRLVDVLVTNLHIPRGELRCTSVPGYQLDLGVMAPDVLRRELGSAVCVIAMLTPNSVTAEWLLFELGAAWANARVPIPLLAGDLEDKDIPGPFHGAVGGHVSSPVTLDRVLEKLHQELSWPRRTDLQGRQKLYEFVEYASRKAFTDDSPRQDLRASFTAKRARLGSHQGRLLDYVMSRQGGRPYIPYAEVKTEFESLRTTVYYRLEHLRLLGFLSRTQIGDQGGEPLWGWSLSDTYRREVGL
jgi:hypothetical protein